ncbi:MAG TPA: DUF4412 domain-containing protein [Thermoanaerobaculia bacterium]|nr:DUF4412 domain-containing protein [Thermoanaerobaculia bacterium]
MKTIRPLACLALLLAAALPAGADTVLKIANHVDEMTMMGQTTPAQDTTYEYWFGDDAIRYDMDTTSIVIRVDEKLAYFINHEEKQYSEMKLPIDFDQMVGPEMAQMMQQMMSGSTKVTPLGNEGSYGGHACDFYQVDLTMGMMQSAMKLCLADDLPVDYAKFKELMVAQSEMAPSQEWMKELSKLEGFPVRSETQTTVMGKTFGSWQELEGVEKKDAPAGHYGPPAGYKNVEFNPMGQMHQGRKR